MVLLLTHVASRISQLSVEMLAALDNDDDDPFLTSDDDEDQRVIGERTEC